MNKKTNALFVIVILVLAVAGVCLLGISMRDDAPSWTLTAALACVAAGTVLNLVWRALRKRAESGDKTPPPEE